MSGQRLSKLAREFNVGISSMIEFLHKKGHTEVENNPNTKVSDVVHDLLVKEFSSDSSAKKESEKVSEQRHNKERRRETVSIDASKNADSENDFDEIPTVVPESEKPHFKVVGKIDLEQGRKTPAPKQVTEKVVEKPVEVVQPIKTEMREKPEETEAKAEPAIAPKKVVEPVIVPEPIKVVEPVAEITIEPVATMVENAKVVAEFKPEPQVEAVKPEPVAKVVTPTVSDTVSNVISANEEHNNEIATDEAVVESDDSEGVFKHSTAKFESNIKVVDKIDLSLINDRTRPKKKSKEEKRREREDRDRVKRPDNVVKKPATPASAVGASGDVKPVDPNKEARRPLLLKAADRTVPADGSPESIEARKKRKRIRKDKEKVDLTKPADFKPGVVKPGQKTEIAPADRKSLNLRDKKTRRPIKAEVNTEDVERQVKETLARLTLSKGGKGDKHRRTKRKAIADRSAADMERSLEDMKLLKLAEFVTANDLATMMDVQVTQIIATCMSLGIFVSINQRLDAETIVIVADEFGYDVEFVTADDIDAITEEDDAEEDLISRPPIITVMGHVDHGKTSLLDFIRSANVIAGEAGGITQHIGAYNVTLEDGRKITFLDTPGHEAFTAMRARGAKITDVAIIIVAADDSVMPQTIEAINHAAAAGVPIVFAINKIDKVGANPEKIREALANMNYLVEDWGGKYQCQEISAKKGLGISDLLEKVLLEAEMLDLKANPNRRASGSIIESSLDKGRGYVATILVQTGTLKVGDVMLAGQFHGNVKAMFNERGQRVEKAGPSEPVMVLGLNGAPTAGDNFNVLSSEKEAREVATKRAQLQREQGLRTQKHITLDEIGRRIAIGNFQELNVIVKGDVDGSIEALADSLIKLSTNEIQVNVIHKAVGQISESDITLAAASNAIVVGFQVRPSIAARRIAEKEEIEIRLYSVIYKAIEEVKQAMEGMLSPEIKEEITATLEVIEVFKITKVGTVAGCMVREGKIKKNSRVRLVRDGIVVYTGLIESLKRFKEDVREVASGYDCGLGITNYNDIREGDFIEGFEEVEVKKKL